MELNTPQIDEETARHLAAGKEPNERQAAEIKQAVAAMRERKLRQAMAIAQHKPSNEARIRLYRQRWKSGGEWTATGIDSSAWIG